MGRRKEIRIKYSDRNEKTAAQRRYTNEKENTHETCEHEKKPSHRIVFSSCLLFVVAPIFASSVRVLERSHLIQYTCNHQAAS